jgi:cell division control protein 7
MALFQLFDRHNSSKQEIMSANKKDKDVKLMKLHAEVSELYEKIPTLKEMYPIVDRIGEGKRSCFRSNSVGTFSAVYKALDKRHRFFDNSSWRDVSNTKSFMVTHPTINGQYMKTMFVALKKIYVTSSPQRLYNEINMLYQLGGKNNVIPIIEAFRQKDQLIVAMPYFEHLDFRVVMHLMDGDDLKLYMHNLLTALSHIHSFGIIHRDLKPSNFLFDLKRKRGVLVDFGLAQYEHELFGATQAAQDNIAKQNPSKKRKAEPLPPGFYTKDTRYDQLFLIINILGLLLKRQELEQGVSEHQRCF